MPVKLNDIKYLMINKKSKFESSCQHPVEFNMALEEQSNVSIGLNREKLVTIIAQAHTKSTKEAEKEAGLSEGTFIPCKPEDFLDIADAIIAAESTLIEKVK